MHSHVRTPGKCERCSANRLVRAHGRTRAIWCEYNSLKNYRSTCVLTLAAWAKFKKSFFRVTFVKNVNFELEFAVWGAQNLTFPEGVHAPNSRPSGGRLLWWGRDASFPERRRQDYSRSLSPEKTTGTKATLYSLSFDFLPGPSHFGVPAVSTTTAFTLW